MRGKLNAGSPDGPQGHWVDPDTDGYEAQDSALALQDLRSRAGEDVAVSKSLENGVITGETAALRRKTKGAVVRITAKTRGFAGKGFKNVMSILGDVPSKYARGINFDFVSFDVRKIVVDFLSGLLMEDNKSSLKVQSVLDCAIFLHTVLFQAYESLDPDEMSTNFLSAKQSAEVLSTALKGVNGEAREFMDRLSDLIAGIEDVASVRRASGRKAKGRAEGGYDSWDRRSDERRSGSQFGELDFD